MRAKKRNARPSTAAGASALRRRKVPEDARSTVVIGDLRLPGMGGIELLKRAKTASPDIEVILITGYGTVETAVEALKEGAYHFIAKPLKKAQLLRFVERAAEKQHLARENYVLRTQLRGHSRRVIHASPEMRGVMRVVEQVGASSATVLITGDQRNG
jgi:two-component system, NtrC family, response regulator HydG